MPTNYLRRSSKRAPPHLSQHSSRPALPAEIEVKIASVIVRVTLAATPSAERIIAALPFFSNAETWGDSIHFEVPIPGGRDRTARINAEVGSLYYWAEDRRLILIYGPTPISGRSEIRLPRPCNLIGTTSDDLTALKKVHPGQKVTMQRT